MAQWVDDRRNWKLTLLGGIEQARHKLPDRKVLTSRPYPVLVEDALSTMFDTDYIRVPPATVLDDMNTAVFGTLMVSLSRPIGDQELSVPAIPGTVAFGVEDISLSRPIGDQFYDMGTDHQSTKFGVLAISLKTVLFYYEMDTEHATQKFNVEGITLL